MIRIALIAISVLTGLAVGVGQTVPAFADFPAPPPPPPSAPPPPPPTPTPQPAPKSVIGNPTHVEIGPYVVGVGVWYVVRGMQGVWIIGVTEQRQATGCEFLTWPLQVCPKLSPRERKYLRLALTYGNLPSVQEKLLFARANGGSFSWPSNAKEMQAAIKFEKDHFPYDR